MSIISRFEKIRKGLTKSRESLVRSLQAVLPIGAKIDDVTLERLEEILIAADIGPAVTQKFLAEFKEKYRLQSVPPGIDPRSFLQKEMVAALNTVPPSMSVNGSAPFVIMIVGVNGVGKTTTVGKLAYLFKTQGKNVLIGAVDTFRAAANEQLEIWAKRAGVDIIGQKHGADPAAVAYDTVSAAVARKYNVVLLDTAGRLHTRVNLMDELKKIRRSVGKKVDGAPHRTLLVLDAAVGQNSLQQAKLFKDSVGVDGLVVTKLDGTAKGGALVSIAADLRIPVEFIGVGEDLDDLQPFDAAEYVSALFGEG